MAHPLSGIRILDLGQLYQGPYCGMILAHLGAEVIKVEPPSGEAVRHWHENKETPEAQLLNPSKLGITLDLKSPAGTAAFEDLIAESDVLIENYRVGTMSDLGLGYDDLREINPELIYGHGSGFGDSGPYADYPAVDFTIQAMGGIMDSTGFPNQPPVKAGPALSDFLGGIHLASGVLAALYEREETGEGRYVEVGMFDCVYPIMISQLSKLVLGANKQPRTGNRHSEIAPYNVYEAGDGHLALICTGDRQWRKLADLMDRPDLLDDDRFETVAKRAANVEAVDDLVESWLVGQSVDEVVPTLLEHDIPAAAVNSIDDVVENPQLEHRGMLNWIENQGKGTEEIPVPGSPIRFRGGDSPPVRPSPELGADTAAVLSTVAGYSEDEIDSLRSEDAI